MKNTALRSIRQTAFLCEEYGTSIVVISPGSRNAPLNMAFARSQRLKCISVQDERVAAFYALGAAIRTRRIAVLVCTSGSAVLNYAPAIAEAYFQQVPLLVLSADRPSNLVGQGDGQTIFQKDVFGKHVKASFQFPDESETNEGVRECNRIMNQALHLCNSGVPGPVHVNIPLGEPLYEQLELDTESFEVMHWDHSLKTLNSSDWKELKSEWRQYKKKLIVIGQMNSNEQLDGILDKMIDDDNCVVLCESTSNIKAKKAIRNIDRLMLYMEDDDFLAELFKADLLISIGGAIVSKKVKSFFRKNKPVSHWYLGQNNTKPDVFQSLTHCIDVDASEVFRGLLEEGVLSDKNYIGAWLSLDKSLAKLQLSYEEKLPYCDYTIIKEILSSLPKNTDLHIGNSSPVRYSNLFQIDSSIEVYCNRGTSGIDGMSSTAVGSAMLTDRINVLITGDIAFMYDSNAFWSNELPSQLRVIVINNGGGGIFRIIPGPDQTEELETYFETGHQRNMKSLAQAYDLEYALCKDMKDISLIMGSFYHPSQRPKLLEIKTDGLLSAQIQRRYFKKIKESYEQSEKLANA